MNIAQEEVAEETGSMVQTPLSLCVVCGEKPYKYRCPQCRAQTCGLECVKRHKVEANCSGRTDAGRLGVIPITEFTDTQVERDFSLLESIREKFEETKRQVDLEADKRQRANQDAKRTHPFALLKKCEQFGIRYRYCPAEFDVRRQNATRFGKGGRIVWRVRWEFWSDDQKVYPVESEVSDLLPVGQTLLRLLSEKCDRGKTLEALPFLQPLFAFMDREKKRTNEAAALRMAEKKKAKQQQKQEHQQPNANSKESEEGGDTNGTHRVIKQGGEEGEDSIDVGALLPPASPSTLMNDADVEMRAATSREKDQQQKEESSQQDESRPNGDSKKSQEMQKKNCSSSSSSSPPAHAHTVSPPSTSTGFWPPDEEFVSQAGEAVSVLLLLRDYSIAAASPSHSPSPPLPPPPPRNHAQPSVPAPSQIRATDSPEEKQQEGEGEGEVGEEEDVEVIEESNGEGGGRKRGAKEEGEEEEQRKSKKAKTDLDDAPDEEREEGEHGENLSGGGVRETGLKEEKEKGKTSSRFIRIDPKKTWRENLRGVTVMEFPVVFISSSLGVHKLGRVGEAPGEVGSLGLGRAAEGRKAGAGGGHPHHLEPRPPYPHRCISSSSSVRGTQRFDGEEEGEGESGVWNAVGGSPSPRGRGGGRGRGLRDLDGGRGRG
eukprot:Cvel_9560.t1-p1 / transcript=Cvel_9560.t1 / gene=Cvel_9560 / organism=Chromera_velia_CCMP2878 / gene_product=Box C/D snoRNA protein 1, putative / transcript_product=Box C/D snoRNA protein 1, putative / location=Cvel_scaffold554:8-4607(-) / protein_length=657 / sequence_SO=supercontig / SO=protein_coding / is_pseudo=false